MRNKKSYRDKRVVDRVVKELEYNLTYAYSCQNHLEKFGNLSENQLNILYKMIQGNTYIQKLMKDDLGK